MLEFEHKGWQSKQCELFADIFSEAIRNGLPAIQTQHPGLYYQQAAQHAIARRELAEELCASESAPKVDNSSVARFERKWFLKFHSLLGCITAAI